MLSKCCILPRVTMPDWHGYCEAWLPVFTGVHRCSGGNNVGLSFALGVLCCLWVAAMITPLNPLQTLFDAAAGVEIPLPEELARLYGSLRFTDAAGRPWVIGNFVSTLDGVAAFDDPRYGGGAQISGSNAHDHMVMGLLRAVAGAVVSGAGTLRAEPKHIWTSRHIYRPLAAAYAALRTTLGLAPDPLNVFVTARGDVDLGLPVFASGEVPVLIVTTSQGAQTLRRQTVPARVHIDAVSEGQSVAAADVLVSIGRIWPARLVLVEGGPRLMSAFFYEHKLDELFLTIAPQVAGRAGGDRPGFVAGRLFAPDDPRWGRLVSVRRAESHLLLRYAFPA
jgi:riboflavin biosynthesis pyrimidine reductase